MADVSGLPTLALDADLDAIRAWCQLVRQQNWVREPVSVGDPLAKFVTKRELVGYNLLSYSNSGGGLFEGVPTDPFDDSAPTNITGLAVAAALENFIVTWDPITYTQGGGNAYTEVFGAVYSGTGPLPTFADATLRGTASGSSTILALPVQPGVQMHFWVGAVTMGGTRQIAGVGPTGGLNGVSAKTGADVTSMLNALTAAAFNPSSPYTNLVLRADLFTICPAVTFYQTTTPTATATGQLWLNPSTGVFKVWDGTTWAPYAVNPPFFVTTTPITQNGVTVPPGVYITDAYIANGTITNAQIGNLAVDNAKIANLSAAKLTAGAIAVGEYIQSASYLSGSSGWRIDGAGNAEFNNVTVRGTLFGTSGNVGGANIGTTYVESPGYNGTTHVGWHLDSSTGKITAAALLITDSSGTRIFNTEATLTAPVLQIGSALTILANGTATFGGTLTAANVVNTSQLVANSVTNTVSVASNTTQTVTGSGATGPNVVATAPSITVAAGSNVLLNGCISFSFEATNGGSPVGDVGSVTVRILRGGTPIWTSGAIPMTARYVDGVGTEHIVGGGCISPVFVETPGAGSYVYKIDIATATSPNARSITAKVYSNTLIVTEIKR